MAFFLSQLPVLWPWLILIAAQVLVLTGRTAIGLSVLVLFGSVALSLGLMSPLAAAIIALGVLGASFLPRLSGWAAGLGHLALIVWCVALGAHLVPGFYNLRILDQVLAGPDSAAFTLHLNMDKPMVFFAVLLAWPAMLNTGRMVNLPSLIFGLALLPILFAIGLAAEAVRPEITLPPWWLIFALSNLFLTCLTEEAFFRGYLQSVLVSRIGVANGIALASLAFGLAHFGGGPELVIFASLLGLACGLAYSATGRLWVPVAMHFAFNFVHLVFFTYPAPA